MIDYFYILAVLCGCLAAFDRRTFGVRNRTALLLVLSAGISALLPLIGVPFDPLLWIAIDLGVVIIPLLEPKRSVSDALIVALFVPIWPTYIWYDPLADAICTLLVIVQFVLAIDLLSMVIKAGRRLGILAKSSNILKLEAA